MSKISLRLLFTVLLISTIFPGTPGSGGLLLAQEDAVPEVGGTSSSPDAEPNTDPDLDSLDAMLDLAVVYTRFSNEDMRDSYGGLPVVAVGFSFQTAKKTRAFLSLGYGENKGNAFHGLAGFSGAENLKVRTIPLQLGMKVDLARSRRVRVYAGAAVEFAWMEETIPFVDEFGKVVDLSSSGTNTGFQLTFGPEFVLGSGGQAVGLEFGWGGSRGTVSAKGHSHAINLTGYRGRLYFALKL